VVPPDRSLLESARAAARRRAWGEAFALFTQADEAEPLGASDLEALGEAAWTTAHYAEAFVARERAYAAYLEEGQGAAAAAVAMDMANDYYPRGQLAVADGWRSSAERLLEDVAECRAHGLLAWCRAQIALLFEGDEEACAGQGHEMVAIGERLGDRGLQMLGRATEARALARGGQVADAFRLLGEAMAGALSGGVEPWAAANIFCQTLTVCIELGDFRRGAEWTEAAQRCCARESIVPASGDCRVHKACMLRWSGAWGEAEREATLGCEELNGNVMHMGPALYEIGEIRLRRGELAAAEEAFAQAHELGRPPQPGLALLRLAQGRAGAAAQMLDEALVAQPLDLPRAALLPARVEFALASGDVARAGELAAELADIAERFEMTPMAAAVAGAQGAIAVASGEAAHATTRLRHAVELWSAVGAPYEAARTRAMLAQALLARGDKEDAALELRAARSTFERLGAVPDARRVGESLEAVSDGDRAPQRAVRTFVFTDIVKSTPLVEALGDEAWFDLLRWHDQTLRELFADHDGDEVRHTGDGFFVTFERPERAFECAVAIQRRLAEHRRTHGFAPSVRIGVHADEAARHGADFAGRGVHVAARIGALADGGEILASASTAAGASKLPDGERRTVPLKGVSEPVELVAVSWR
jgi:class 3 adenylate cyclase